MLSLHSLKNRPGAKKRKMRVGCGRGSGKGKTCGRGHKGQYSRSGHKHKPAFEGGQMRLIRRLPKRGFNSGNKLKYLLVQVSSLDQFQNETEVTSALVRTIGLAKGDKQAGVKILGEGALTKKLTVRVQAFSESARRKIESAGGKCEVIK